MRIFLDRGFRHSTKPPKHGMKPRRTREACRFVRLMPRLGLTDILKGTPRWQ